MDGPDIEHRTEIRRGERRPPRWLGAALVAVVGALVVVVLAGGGTDGERAARPSPGATSATTGAVTTTAVTAPPPIHGVAVVGPGDGVIVPARSADLEPPGGISGPTALGAPRPVVTTGRVVVLDSEGTLFAGRPGEAFTAAGCCYDDLVPSSEPHHVWVRSGADAVLVDLDLGPTTVRLALDGDRLVGPASFGLVTSGADGTVRWRRPSSRPTDTAIPRDRRVLDSGGERVLVSAAAPAGRVRHELWSIVDGSLLDVHEGAAAPPGTEVDGDGVLAPDGSTLALLGSTGWVVRDAADGALRDVLPAEGEPVWVGGQRFAMLLPRRIAVSAEEDVFAGASWLRLAEQSP